MGHDPAATARRASVDAPLSRWRELSWGQVFAEAALALAGLLCDVDAAVFATHVCKWPLPLRHLLFVPRQALYLALAWAAALTPAWSLGPTGSVQLVDGAVGGSLGAQLAWASRGWGLSLAGRWGDERRLTSLNESLTFATNDRIRGAASVAFRAPLGGGISLAVQYEWLHLLTGDATRATDAEAHFLTAAVLGAW